MVPNLVVPLTTFEARVGVILQDATHRIFPASAIDEGIRQALSEYNLVLSLDCTILNLDSAPDTTLPRAHEYAIVTGASGFAARYNLIDYLSRLAPTGMAALQTAINTWCQVQLEQFHKSLDQYQKSIDLAAALARTAELHATSSVPYSSLHKPSSVTGDPVMNQPTVTSVVATIAAGASLSDTIATGGLPICGIQMPAAWDAAVISFQASCDVAANVANVFDSTGTEVTAYAAASEFVTLDPAIFAGMRYVAVRSGPSTSAVVQTAIRSITLAIRTV